MKKLAIFVEGQTEVIFVEKLLKEIGNKKSISVTKKELKGGRSCPTTIRLIGKDEVTENTQYQILIYSSCNDEKVLSDIKEQYESLIHNGYEAIIGLRDLFPTEYSQLNRIQNRINFVLSNQELNKAKIVIAVMEVETWFLAETTHFNKIHSDLTEDSIKNILDFNTISNFEKDVSNPADTLNNIYKLIGFAYKKKEKQVQRTVDNLDYEELYINTRNNLSSLNEFLNYIDSFFET